MRKGLFFLLFILPAVILADTPTTPSITQAIFKNVQGDVQVRTKKETHPAKEGLTVNQGDTVIARKGGSATLRLFDGSEVEVSPLTEFVVTKLKKGQGNDKFIKFKLLIGQIKSTVEKLTTSKSCFDVEAGGVVCAVRGTIVVNILDPIGQAMGVAVQKGVVAVTSAPSSTQPNPSTQLIPAGNSTSQPTNPFASAMNGLIPIGAKPNSTAGAQMSNLVLTTQKSAFLTEFSKIGINNPDITKQVVAILSQPTVSLQGLQALDQLVLVAAAQDQKLATKDPNQAKQIMVVLNSMTQNLQNIATLEKGSIPATNASAQSAQTLEQTMSKTAANLSQSPAQVGTAANSALSASQLSFLKQGQTQMANLTNQTNSWLQGGSNVTSVLSTYAQVMQIMNQQHNVDVQTSTLNMITMTNMAISSSQQIQNAGQAAANAQQQQAAQSLAGAVSGAISAVTSLSKANPVPKITINPAPGASTNTTNPAGLTSPAGSSGSSGPSAPTDSNHGISASNPSAIDASMLQSMVTSLPSQSDDSMDVLIAQTVKKLKDMEDKSDQAGTLSAAAQQKQLQDKAEQLKAVMDMLDKLDPNQAKTITTLKAMMAGIMAIAPTGNSTATTSMAAQNQAVAAELKAIQDTLNAFIEVTLINLKTNNDVMNSTMDAITNMMKNTAQTASGMANYQADLGPAPQAVQHHEDESSLNDPALQVMNGGAPGSNAATQANHTTSNSGTNNSLNTIQQHNNTNNTSSTAPHGYGSGGD